METIKLAAPAVEHQAAAEDYKGEFFSAGEAVINGSALLDQMEYPGWLEHVRQNSSPHTVQPDWVVSSTFFAIRERDGRIIGMIDIRHSLSNEFLAQYGGHIGYSVRPGERRRGYATQMLKLALAYARSLGLSRVMLGCYSDNLPSKKVIETCGGVKTATKPYTDGKPMDLYWIEL